MDEVKYNAETGKYEVKMYGVINEFDTELEATVWLNRAMDDYFSDLD